VHTQPTLDTLCIDTLRTLAMDAIQQANSGHPGAAMALAPVAYTLFTRHLRFNPANPRFANRDRFVLSAGHASMLLYGTLHLSGYDASLDDIRRFRQLGSRCPGHPEYGELPGVEITTGPLGQGAAASVGMAMAERWLRDRFNRPGHEIVGYRVYAVLGDGCMMEGVSGEAASLAGHLGLGNLTWIYDSNHISIDGSTDLTFTEDVPARFKAYGWRVLTVEDANDVEAVHQALASAAATTDRPSLVKITSVIAYGAPTKAGTASAHGEPLGEEEIRGTKEFYGWDRDATFVVPPDVRRHMTVPLQERGERLEREWNDRFAAYAQAHPTLAAEWNHMQAGTLPEGWDANLPAFPADGKGMASRAAGGKVLQAVAGSVPWLIGGAADLTPSTKTYIDGSEDFRKGGCGHRNIRFGVREHAMAAVCNGLALSRLRSFGATFLVFADYCRPSIRMAAMMKLPVIYVFTHDSIGVGEDGPTHQPVEHLASLRVIPNLDVVRPGDANEVTEAWRHAMQRTDGPVALALSRQNLPTLDRARLAPASGTRQGGYILAEATGEPEVILIGTGSELSLCVRAHEQLTTQGVRVRVVSMPCAELFDRQDAAYREHVLPASCPARVAVEAGVAWGWRKYVGLQGIVVGLDRFGASAPCADVMKHFGFTMEAVVEAARQALAM